MVARVSIAGLLAFLYVAPAAAQSEGDDERAAVHFRAATSYYSEARYEEALEEFQEAYRLSGRAEMLYNIGLSLENLERWEEAADAHARFVDAAPDDPNVGTARLRMERARLRADAERGEEDLGGGEESDAARDADGPSLAPWIVLGASAAVGVAALVTGLVAHGIAEDLDGACTMGVCPADRRDDASRGEALALSSTILTFVAAAGAITSVVLLLVGLGDDEEEPPPVAVLPVPGGGYLTTSVVY